MAKNFFTNSTERTEATLESLGMRFMGAETGNTKPVHTDFDSIGDAVRARNVIDTDITFYVSKTGNDTTGDGTSSLPWLTVEHALEVVNSFALLPGAVPTIQVGDGVYTMTSSIDTAHPGTVITGENTLTLAVTSVQSSSGSAGAYSIVLNVDDVTDILVTDECAITDCTGGTNPEYLAGTWDITNVDAVNSRITVASTHNVGVPSGSVTATLTIYKSVIAFSGVTGIDNAPITANHLALVGDATASTNGVDISSNVSFNMDNVTIRNFGSHGINCSLSGTVSATSATISGNGTYGINCQLSGSVSASSSIISGNGTHGVLCQLSGSVSASSSIISGHGGSGVLCQLSGSVAVPSTTISGNGTHGILCQISGSVYAASTTISGNGGKGILCQTSGSVYALSTTISGAGALYAAKYGYIYVVSASITGTVSPALNTQGNEYGYIDS